MSKFIIVVEGALAERLAFQSGLAGILPEKAALEMIEAELSGLEGTLHKVPPPCAHIYYGHDRADGVRVRRCIRCHDEVEIGGRR